MKFHHRFVVMTKPMSHKQYELPGFIFSYMLASVLELKGMKE